MDSYAKDKLDVALKAIAYLLDDVSIEASDRYLAAALLHSKLHEHMRNLHPQAIAELKE